MYDMLPIETSIWGLHHPVVVMEDRADAPVFQPLPPIHHPPPFSTHHHHQQPFNPKCLTAQPHFRDTFFPVCLLVIASSANMQKIIIILGKWSKYTDTLARTKRVQNDSEWDGHLVLHNDEACKQAQ